MKWEYLSFIPSSLPIRFNNIILIVILIYRSIIIAVQVFLKMFK